METRPQLSSKLNEAEFRSYYYLKEELMDFCRQNGLPISGGKPELTERIAAFLNGQTVTPAEPRPSRRRSSGSAQPLADASRIGPEFVCTQQHRDYFRSRLGSSFSFNVAFQQWLKAHPEKTLAEACEAFLEIRAEKKKGKTEIGRQFEYNTYIRDFFEANPGRSLAEAIRCWKAKKQACGTHRYEPDDLRVLESER